MNKSLILVLAVCLVSVHAFVKREAPQPLTVDSVIASAKSQFEDLKKQLDDVLNSDGIKKTFNDASDTVKEIIDSIKVHPTDAPKA